MTINAARHVRKLVTLPRSMLPAIRAYAERTGAPSESAAIRQLLRLGLAADVEARVRASIGQGIALPGDGERMPADAAPAMPTGRTRTREKG